VNIVRTALEALAAVMGGTQSLHTNSYDEALALPTERAVKIALRTQQVLGYESGVVDTTDPLGGSYLVETLTNEIEQRAWEYVEKIDGMGGAVQAIEAGFYQDEIADAAYKITQGVESGDRVIVGVNKFVDAEGDAVEIQTIDEEGVRKQVDGLRELRATRDQAAVDEALGRLERTARGDGNLLAPMRDALRARATLGEVSDVLRSVFAEYRPSR
jgi:methylmalonyl-CoA mutase N-terminal domain/subunit